MSIFIYYTHANFHSTLEVQFPSTLTIARNKKSHPIYSGNQNLWPDLPQQLIGFIVRNRTLVKDIHSKGVTKSWKTALSRKCGSNNLTPPWLELAFDHKNDHSQPHTFNIPYRPGCIWYWFRDGLNIATCHRFNGWSQGLIVVKGVSDSSNYTLMESYLYFGLRWNLPPWDASVPFLSCSLSNYPWTSDNRPKNKSIIMVLTGVSSPAFVYLRIWEGDGKWVKNASKVVDPFYSDPNQKDKPFRFGNGVWLKEQFYALSIQGTVAVIEDVGCDVRITRIGKRVVPSDSSLHSREFMVEFGGVIFVVFIVSRKCVKKVDYVEVYELNTVGLSWIKKERLGDLTLFCGAHCCMGVSAKRVGCRRNCIYVSIGVMAGGSMIWKVAPFFLPRQLNL